MYKKAVMVATAGVVLSALVACNSEESPKVVTSASTACSLDVINGEKGALVRVKRGTATFLGWAADSGTNTAPAELQVVLKNNEGVSHAFGESQRFERPDVVKAYRQDGFLKSGFAIKADTSALAPGAYGVALKMIEGNRVVVCSIKKNVVIE